MHGGVGVFMTGASELSLFGRAPVSPKTTGFSGGAASLVEMKPFCKIFDKTTLSNCLKCIEKMKMSIIPLPFSFFFFLFYSFLLFLSLLTIKPYI